MAHSVTNTPGGRRAGSGAGQTMELPLLPHRIRNGNVDRDDLDMLQRSDSQESNAPASSGSSPLLPPPPPPQQQQQQQQQQQTPNAQSQAQQPSQEPSQGGEGSATLRPETDTETGSATYMDTVVGLNEARDSLRNNNRTAVSGTDVNTENHTRWTDFSIDASACPHERAVRTSQTGAALDLATNGFGGWQEEENI